jgi:biotin carboxylase
LGAEVVVASEEEQAMAGAMGGRFVRIDLCDPDEAAERIVAAVSPVDAVVGVDEQGVLVAAKTAELLGLAHNAPGAVAVTRDKARMRTVLSDAGLAQPRFQLLGPREDAGDVELPCVVKATSLSGSRGVIRADTAEDAAIAVKRVRAIVEDADAEVLVEAYVPGAEVAVEGLLRSGHLGVLAIFDKPDPLEGPYFEETIYVTPSRLPGEVQDDVARTVQLACAAIGLVEGPVHAEVRIGEMGCVLLEVAARSIGGLCSRALRFGAGISLEEIILRHALGVDPGDLRRATGASGVMMIPIPRSGVLAKVDGVAEAEAVAGVQGVEITIPRGQGVQALPEGDRYLGFIFATGETPGAVERALREAHGQLRISIDPA